MPKRLDLLWKFLKPVSFALIGKEINYHVLEGHVIGYGALLVLVGSLVIKMVAGGGPLQPEVVQRSPGHLFNFFRFSFSFVSGILRHATCPQGRGLALAIPVPRKQRASAKSGSGWGWLATEMKMFWHRNANVTCRHNWKPRAEGQKNRAASRDDHFLVLVFSFAWLLHIYPHMAEICRERNVPTLQFPVFPKQLSK